MKRQRGFSLFTAVFLLVVVAALVGGLVNVFSVQQGTTSLDLLGLKAYQSARAGLEWGLYQQLRVQPPNVACFNQSSFKMPSDGALSDFTVTVLCEDVSTSGNVAGDSRNRWRVTSSACNQPSAVGVCPNPNPSSDYAQRVMQVEF